ncbi:MAG TPA: hypothetical protein VIH43_04365 [Chthoniobacterales bacterium]
MKREAIGHTKLKRLCRDLKVRHYVGIGILEALWHMTALESPQGNIGKLSNEDIAFGIDWQDSQDVLIDALVQSKWLDRHPEHRLLVHDWHEHCDDYVDMKVARSTLFYANGAKARMNRLSVAERTKIEENYARQNPIRAHGVQINATACPEPDHVFDRKSLVDHSVSAATQNGSLCAQNGDPCAQNLNPCAQHATPCEEMAQNATTMPSHALPSHAMPSQASPHQALPDLARCAEIAPATNGARATLKSSSNGKTPEYKLDAFSEWAHDVYDRHPKQKNQFAVLHALKQTFAGKPAEQQLLDENHPLWIAYWQLDPNYPRFVPVLAETNGGGWINDQAWRKKPPPPPDTRTKNQIANDAVYQKLRAQAEVNDKERENRK